MSKYWINLLLIVFFVRFGDVVVNMDNIIYMQATEDNKTEMVYGIGMRAKGMVGIKTNRSIIIDMTLKEVLATIQQAKEKAK